MTNKYKNKYRITSVRMRNWDYRWNAPYFVTICTQNRLCYFGDVVNGKMQLSEIGEIVEQEWLKTFEMRPDMNLHMGAWQIMPNHFHAIIVIGENDYNRKTDINMETGHRMNGNVEMKSRTNGNMETGRCTDAMHCVSTMQPTTPVQPIRPVQMVSSEFSNNNPAKNQFGPQSKNLGSIIRGFKSGVTTDARLIHADFAWQSRFHDHIIRDEQSYMRIEKYIIDNPLHWGNDIFNDKKP
jgi:putative transposase